MDQYELSFAGSGRVAGALCRRLYKAGSKILKIVSRNRVTGIALAESCNAEWSGELSFPGSAGIIIVAVPDHSLREVLDQIRCGDETIVTHTAGSLGLDVFPGSLKRKGVLYPLQTFSKDREPDFRNLPFFIEASDDHVSEILATIAESAGGVVHYAGTEKRKSLHLAAVFMCNFTNHMLALGSEIASKAGFDRDIFKPLVEETIAKAMELGPRASQTGPAIRNDLNIIEKHLELLSFSPEYRKIYKDLTESIIRYHNTAEDDQF